MRVYGRCRRRLVLFALTLPVFFVAMETIAETVAAAGPPILTCEWRLSSAHPDGHTLYDIWGSGYNNVYAVGDAGTILHYDGVAWNGISHGLTDVSLYGIWGSSHSDIYVVGDAGTILHFNGESWNSISHGLTTDSLKGVWGSSHNDVFIVGGEVSWMNSTSTALHYDGENWRRIDGDECCPPLADVWGSSRDDVYVVGEVGLYSLGFIKRYDGDAWNDVEEGLGGAFKFDSIWGSSGNDIYAAVGTNGTIMHYGCAWQFIPENGLYFPSARND